MILGRPLFALALLLGVSAVAGAVGAATNVPAAWFTVLFEAIILLAAVFGIRAARRGQGAEALALSLLCIAGAVFAASVLGYVGAGQTRTIRGVPLRPLLFARLGIAALFALAAAWTALGPNRAQTIPRALLGLALGAPVVALAALAYTGHLSAWTAPLGQALRAVLAVAGFIVFTSLLAASVQVTISAFANTNPGDDDSFPSPSPTPPRSPSA